MQIVLLPAAITDQPALINLMQLYRYDFSEVDGGDVNDQGCFDGYALDMYWAGAGCYPFLIDVDGRLAGFALVNQQSRLHASYDGHAVAEFFVMRKYRRQGVGRSIASQMFDHFPGRWEIASIATNVLAHTFWRSTVDRYTSGHYDEVWFQKDGWRGPVQSFVAPPPRSALPSVPSDTFV
jgi:predicted acetyltransferase